MDPSDIYGSTILLVSWLVFLEQEDLAAHHCTVVDAQCSSLYR